MWRALDASLYSLDRSLGEASDDVVLIYHRLSGETHVLNFLSWLIFDLCRSGAVTRGDLIDQINQSLASSGGGLPVPVFDKALDELDHAGLVYPCDQDDA